MEFRKMELGELCNVVTDYVANGSFKSLADNVKYSNSGYAQVIRLVDYNNKYSLKDSIWVSKEGYDYLKKSKLYGGEIIITNVGANLGTVFIAPTLNHPMTLGPNAVMLKSNENDLYLYYWLISPEGRNKIKAIVTGSAMPKFNKTDLKKVKISVPNVDIQKKIVHILSNIDKKIELNNNINDNLFEISCLNYKKWYEKLNNNLETTYSKLKELGNIVMGQSPKGESYNFEKIGVPLINGAADYENGFLMAQKYTSMPTKICKKNDLIFCIRATIGLLVISDNEYCLGRGVAGITKINEEYKEYAFHIIYNSIEEFKKMATGSVIVGISRNDIESIKVKIPTKEQIQEFHKIQSPIFNKIENIRRENQTLVKLRDTLLPKLMNGEIDLDKIEI